MCMSRYFLYPFLLEQQFTAGNLLMAGILMTENLEGNRLGMIQAIFSTRSIAEWRFSRNYQ